jgi:hypothetical protein
LRKLNSYLNDETGFRWAKAIAVFTILALISVTAVTGLASSNRHAFEDRTGDSIEGSRNAREAASEKGKARTAEPEKAEDRDATARAGSHAAPSVEERMHTLEEALRLQNEKIEQMGKTIADQQRTIELLNGKSAQPQPAASSTGASDSPVVADASPAPASKPADTSSNQTEKKVEDLYKRFGSIRFSGDLRFRVETFDNQGFDSLTEPAARRRLRVRGRLALDGTVNKNFDWGLRIASGTFTDPISTNQSLTDFFERKPFMLDRLFVRYDSKTDKVGVQLVAGKFEPTFRRTQMIWDDDVTVEGASEALYFKTGSTLKQIKLVAFQLPFNELSGAKDGVLYGGQAQTDWQFSPEVSATVDVAYYDWNHPDGIIPALNALATQVNGGIFSGAVNTGGQNGALGTTNRIVRNAQGTPIGFLAGFNLIDVLANLNWQVRKYPVTFTFDYVHNATSRVRDEKDGWWGGVQVGRTKEKGDWLAGYYFTRIEQDAVLVPFNFSDILASNSRAHMPTFAYQLTNGVVLQWTGLFSQRANQVVTDSPFNRFVNRMQFDVIYKF